MTGDARLYIVNTGDVLDEVDRIVDEDIQRCHARLDWLRWIAIVGPLLGGVGTMQFISEFLGPAVDRMTKQDLPYDELLITTAAGLVMALAFLPAHYILRNRATVLLLGIREKVKTLFVRTRHPHDVGRPIIRSGPPGGMSRVRQYMAEGCRFTQPNLASLVSIFLIISVMLFAHSDYAYWEYGDIPPPVRLPSAQPVDEVDVRHHMPSQNTLLTIHHLQRDEMRCTPSDDPTSCRDETHWRISATQDTIWDRDFSDRVSLARQESLARYLRGVSRHEPSDSSIFLRADAAAPFGLVQLVIEACRQAGIEKIEFGVASPQSLSR